MLGVPGIKFIRVWFLSLFLILLAVMISCDLMLLLVADNTDSKSNKAHR